jgi:FkbM family methyltransferase
LFTGISKKLPGGLVSVGYPPLNSEYLEWIGLMAAVVSAQSHFTMVEAGAGWGRWIAAAAKLASARQIPFTLCGIEADPDHFRWMQQVFLDNNLDPANHVLISEAVAPAEGTALFLRHDHPELSYGQHLVDGTEKNFWKLQPEWAVVEVQAQTLSQILGRLDAIDFLAIDLSGAELEILRTCLPALEKVRVLQISINSTKADEEFTRLLEKRGWVNKFRYPMQQPSETPYGRVEFAEGLQTWLHPAAASIGELFEPAGSVYPMAGIPDVRPVGGGGVSVFDTEAARQINDARMSHLASLGLSIEGRKVLDVGGGVGHLAQFFVAKGCEVVSIDAREENLASLRSRYPELAARRLNVETDSLACLGRFDIVFCYGLLYHLENPLAAMRNMAAVCDDLLLLETVVMDHPEPLVRLADEPTETFSQAVGGMATRPTPAFVAMALTRAGFPFVYVPRTPPRHADFQFEWKADHEFFRDGHLLRCVFVASKRPIDSLELALQLTSDEAASGGFDVPSVAGAGGPMDAARALNLARDLFQFRDLVPYPGWHFDIDWDQSDALLEQRRRVWENFRLAGRPGPLEVEWHNGIRLVMYIGNDLTKQLFVAGCFEPNEFAFLNSLLAPGMRFVDAGANEGLYSLFAAGRVGETGRVYAFEPSPRELSRLLHNCALNHFPQVQVFPFALSEESGFRPFSIVEEEHSGQNAFGAVSQGVRLTEVMEVPTRRLDDIAAQEGWDSLDVLKIDVEGWETRLIHGATQILKNMRPLILFECSATALQRGGSSRAELVDYLRSFDYRIYRFDENSGLPSPAAPGEYSDNMIAAPAEKRLPGTNPH